MSNVVPSTSALTSSTSAAADEVVLSLDDSDLPAGASNGVGGSATPSSSASSTLTLTSRTGEQFRMSKAAASLSELFRSMMDGDASASEVPLYHIDADIVRLIVEYCNRTHQTPARHIERPIQSNNLADMTDAWECNFIQSISLENTIRLILAANYLNIKPLLHLASAHIATMIQHKTPQQVRDVFGIRHDATKEEEDDIRRQFKELIG